ncbi:Do family serine endopeptidase [Asticcacaulis sp. BYS171W]|uniref:Do family serine endopeptidase n=1 Tax=Asticcacaulis aquaticus TaxID=2984212 RepID=A0ABT5HQS0_9CAUL|nr:Do family serine endopeptidase [Asticcacaulis aquaticus]MDC7682298.1 Do family serine endopeptidase [Asticcacaulis aquaticus]
MTMKSALMVSAFALLAACSPGEGKSQDYQGFHEAPAPANRKVPGDAGTMKSSFAPVVKQTAPAVVNVYAQRITRQQVDPFWQMFGGGQPQARVEKSLGSGVIVRGDGIIVTNNHVVQGGQELMVVLSDRREFPAKVLLADERTDLAILKLEANGEKFPTIKVDDGHDLEVGDLVLAIGNPFGVGQTVTNGIISAVDRTTDAEGAFIQTDAAINPGNSGGALIDMDGDLIGINSFILSRSGSSAGVGFAIPAAVVKRAVDTALGGKSTLVRPWLGAKGDPVTSDIARSLGLSKPDGVLVSDVYAGGPADQAGLKTGDVVLSVNGEPVNDPKTLNYRVSLLGVNGNAALNVVRAGKILNLNARVVAPTGAPKDQRALTGNFPLTGATVVNLSPAVADELGLDPFAASKGVMVYSLSGRSYAAAAGFRPGDIVKDVNGQAITSTAQLETVLKSVKGRYVVTINRGGQNITAQF